MLSGYPLELPRPAKCHAEAGDPGGVSCAHGEQYSTSHHSRCLARGWQHNIRSRCVYNPGCYVRILSFGGVHNSVHRLAFSDFLTVYNNYAADYREVAEALEKTDHLIDQIVHALYGLGHEEIAMVEGATEQS